MLVTLVVRVQRDITPFFCFYLLWLCAFALLFNVSGVYIVADLEADYPGVHWYIATLIQVFRNSICDISPPDYTYWTSEGSPRTAMVAWAWFLFFLTEFYLMITLLNFLIAEIGDSYTLVVEEFDKYICDSLCDLNREAAVMFDFLAEVRGEKP